MVDIFDIIVETKKYDYELYKNKCKEKNSHAVNIIIFANAVGTYLVATETFSELDYREAIKALHDLNNKNHLDLLKQIENTNTTDLQVKKPCCGGGAVR